MSSQILQTVNQGNQL
jgi:hypothetical protein